MKDDIQVTSDWAKNWNGSIAVKVTSIVLWSILILSFVLTIPFMVSFEKTKLKEYVWEASQVKQLLDKEINAGHAVAEIKENLGALVKNSEIEHLSIVYQDKEIIIGQSKAEHYVIQDSQHVGQHELDIDVLIKLEFPPLEKEIILERAKIGSVIVGFSVLFGLFLFWINRNIVHAPFNQFVDLTKKISQGDNAIRLDEDRDDEFGVLSKFMNQMLDVMESKQADLEKANKELMSEINNREEALAASQQKSAFLANMSHEIRTPLSSIIGYAERLRFNKAKNKNDLDEMLDVILQNGNHLLYLINDILDLSKVEANKLEIDIYPFSIFDLIEGTKNLLKDKVMDQSSELVVNYNFPIPKLINNDQVRTKQILLNLCSNAIRFTEKGTVTLNIAFEKQNNKLVLEIKDTGVGMSAVQIERLFKPFTQADSTITRRYGGTGLGLAISKRLAELMGGDITVQSVEGIGTRFICKIDAGYKIGEPLVMELSEVKLTSVDYIQPLEDKHISGKVLVVEDTLEIQMLVKAYLEDFGVDIDTANNGKEGVDKALTNDYGLVLMDIQMPVMNGKEAIHRLRKAGYTKPVVALTADAIKQNVDEFLELGFTETLTKPIVINELMMKVEQYLSADKVDDDVDFVDTDLRDKLIERLPIYLSELDNAFDESNKEAVLATLHILIGVGGSFGFPKITDLAAELNAVVREQGLESAVSLREQMKECFTCIINNNPKC